MYFKSVCTTALKAPYTETSVTSQLHQYTGMKHTNCRRSRSMTIGTPCMEREQGSQHSESQENHREEDTLHFGRDLQFYDFKNIHGLSSGSVENT